MPYKIYKKQYGYKVCKKGSSKCFSKKPMSKKNAENQMKALYASEQKQLKESVNIFPDEVFVDVYYNEQGGQDVLYRLSDESNLVVNVPSVKELDPTFKIQFKNPQVVKDILNKLTLDDIEAFGEDAIDRADKSEDLKQESLQFESLFKKTIE